jgi:RHS repeat-associated protein
MDVNSGLTQALSDGTNTYLYGMDRIAQSSIANPQSDTEYFLGDALGSVRQMADVPKGDAISGEVVLAQAHDPYGVTANASGAAQTSYGFTAEYTSAAGLIYLRARQYDPSVGRFTSRDTWGGDYNSPLSLNRWNYVQSNPIMYTDPSGHCVIGIDCVFTLPIIIAVLIGAGILMSGCATSMLYSGPLPSASVTYTISKPVLQTAVLDTKSLGNYIFFECKRSNGP